MLNAVLFDLDNTLVDRDRAFREAVRARFSEPGVQAELVRLDDGGRGDRPALFDFWARHAKERMDQARFGQLLARHLAPDPALLDALRTLATHVKLGIVTNGGGATQRAKFRAAGLADVIPAHRLWISAEVGRAKPDPAIFRLACRALGECPGNCLLVGDQEREDAAGAMAAGLRARLVNTVLRGERLRQLIREEQTR